MDNDYHLLSCSTACVVLQLCAVSCATAMLEAGELKAQAWYLRSIADTVV